MLVFSLQKLSIVGSFLLAVAEVSGPGLNRFENLLGARLGQEYGTAQKA